MFDKYIFRVLIRSVVEGKPAQKNSGLSVTF